VVIRSDQLILIVLWITR